MRKIATILSAALLMGALTTAADAAACRDANGKFIKCAKAAPGKATRCKGSNGKFVKCGTPGAKPI